MTTNAMNVRLLATAAALLLMFSAGPAMGGQIPFLETQASQQGGGHQLWTTPANPEGGNQYVGLGSGYFLRESVPNSGNFDTPTNKGAYNSLPVSPSRGGLITMKYQYINGYEHDFGGFMGDIRWRTSTGASYTGIYTRNADGLGNGGGTHPWRPSFRVVDAANNLLTTPGGAGLAYSGVPGFDNLPRENWYELSITADANPASATHNQITQLSTRNITTGAPADVMNNPTDPNTGLPLYVGGGANSTTTPEVFTLYNVGWGTISAYDNVSTEDGLIYSQNYDFEAPTFTGAPLASGSHTPNDLGTAPTQLLDDFDDSGSPLAGPGQGGAFDFWPVFFGAGDHGNVFDVYTFEDGGGPQAAAPEPATVLLAGLALMGFGTGLWRRRRR